MITPADTEQHAVNSAGTSGPSVLFVGEHYRNPKGGLGRYEVELLRSLRQLPGLEVRTTTLTARPAWAKGITRLLTGVSAGAPVLRGRVRYLSEPDPSVDIVHFANQQMSGALWAFRIAQRFGVMPSARVVVTIHDLFPDVCEAVPEFADLVPDRSFGRFIDRSFHRHALKLADQVIVNSQATAIHVEQYLAYPTGRIHVTLLGADHISLDSGNRQEHPSSTVNRASLGLAPDRHIALYVGSLDARKNVEVVARAIRELNRAGTPTDLVIAGSARAPQERIDSVRSSGDGSVHLLGHVSEPDLQALYQLADVFVFPSRFEGFGFPVLEAMANGCPVVASTSTSIPEVAGEAAVLVDPMSVPAWREAISRMLFDKGLRTRYVARGLAHVKSFTWTGTAQATCTAYRLATQ